ncbi:chain length determinant protein EpsF [Sphaerotilus sulfidivorans]|uniref:Chain length determinant protein EpsF n=1 Tax=Sphaerotilus sulfidivorans TaxID=639200 RepID=A0A5C1Q0I7_9BURK|nr:chain length determinant protein EpsF [Sphaerotilus sulfidivorans]NZD46423.1 chain length determinant protein EpsF [Sphaerotilus sulfidivorans]QEN01455.1 chain length determinant protein EpsF [Sphaerotilus sulfidivorans]
MTFSQFLSILRARWIAAAVVLFLTIGVTAAVSLLLPKTYTATATVMIDVRSPDPVAGMVMNGMAMPSYMATQVDILGSVRVAARVVQLLRISENSALREQWNEATGGRGNFDIWVAELLLKSLNVKPARESNVIEVSYRNADPRFAAALANAFVQAYIDTSVALRAQPAKQYSSFFETRSRQLREELEAAQAKLSAYQKEKGITGQDERFDQETQRLNELTSQLVAIQAIAVEAESRSRQARSASDQAADVIGNPVVAGLRSELSRQEARMRELTARLGDAHPQVVEMRANIEEMRRRVDIESQRVSGSVDSNSQIAKRRETEIRAALEAQRLKVLKMKEERQALSVLMREVETVQRNYDQAQQRMSQTEMESENTQTNIAPLTPAVEPVEPSGPRIILNMLMSVFLGLLLAVGVAVMREIMDRRVRSLEDISSLVGMPVMGVLPAPRGRRLAGKSVSRDLPVGVLARLPKPGA